MAGIYIHIPFCKQACYYCDFHFSTSLSRKEEMIRALVKELQLRKEELKDQEIETIYFGGGTPSILSVDELGLLIDEVYKNYNIIDKPEITLEANPDDLTNQRINDLSNTQINRLSIGIQSFFDDDLKSMNRAHNSKEAMDCLSVATRHFDNITIDLIYGVPKMSVERWKQNLQMAFDFGVNHISSYALTVEPKTALASFIKKGKYPKLSDELAEQHFAVLVEETQKKDFVHYEISNFGKEGYLSKHNTSYWLGKPYLGIGPSAHSFNGKERSWNISNNINYIKTIQENKIPQEIESLSKKDRFNEYIMTGLRTIWGVSLKKLEEELGIAFKEYLIKEAQEKIDSNHLILEKGILKVTKKGKFLVDGIASDLFMI